MKKGLLPLRILMLISDKDIVPVQHELKRWRHRSRSQQNHTRCLFSVSSDPRGQRRADLNDLWPHWHALTDARHSKQWWWTEWLQTDAFQHEINTKKMIYFVSRKFYNKISKEKSNFYPLFYLFLIFFLGKLMHFYSKFKRERNTFLLFIYWFSL